jgi:hypothetical protein
VSGHGNRDDGQIAQRDRLVVLELSVAFRGLRVGARDEDACAIAFLEICRAAKVVGVTVGDQDDAHCRWIEPQPREARQQAALDVARGQRVDHQQAGARSNHIGHGADAADRIDVVEDLRRLDRRIVRTIGPRRLAPEAHGVLPARADLRFQAGDLFHDRR